MTGQGQRTSFYYVIKVIITHFMFSTEVMPGALLLVSILAWDRSWTCTKMWWTTKSHCLHIYWHLLPCASGSIRSFWCHWFLCNFIVQQFLSVWCVCTWVSILQLLQFFFFFFTKEPNVLLYLIAPNFCMASTRLATVAPNKSRTRTTTEGSGTVNPYVKTDKQVHWLIDWLIDGLEKNIFNLSNCFKRWLVIR